ncbi:hypothetical protein [Thermomonospora cellulosilytica]|uniref:Uncharacterized protein n=1 Tax=Thermomonospora cellulosilytica TaxID=1411118 RepID=A0A7W3N4A4_9ACTN|nr:hypothetical protein [Thermomonospora cellulosilytica]MBA9007298.1 hypothetical protein [Thermomonospora cellulosilytica]
MPQPVHHDRITNVEATLTDHQTRTSEQPATTPTARAVQLRDLLVDLMHYADAHTIDFDLLLEAAHRAYHREARQTFTPDGTAPSAAVAQQIIGLLAQDVTAAVRDLNLAITGTDARPGLADPYTAQRVLDDLARATRNLARTFPQISRYLRQEHKTGRLVDTHDDPDQAIELAALYLDVAKGTATSLAGALTRTHQAITGMKTTPPDQPTPAELAGRDFPTATPDLSAAAKPAEEPSRSARNVPSPRNTPRA